MAVGKLALIIKIKLSPIMWMTCSSNTTWLTVLIQVTVGSDEIKIFVVLMYQFLMRSARKHEKDERDYRHELEDNDVNLDGGYIRETFSTTAFTRNLELGG